MLLEDNWGDHQSCPGRGGEDVAGGQLGTPILVPEQWLSSFLLPRLPFPVPGPELTLTLRLGAHSQMLSAGSSVQLSSAIKQRQKLHLIRAAAAAAQRPGRGSDLGRERGESEL